MEVSHGHGQKGGEKPSKKIKASNDGAICKLVLRKMSNRGVPTKVQT